MKCDTIPDLEKFLKIQEQALGQEAAEVATTASKLADLYMKAGKQEQAEKLYRRALEIRRNLKGVHKDEIQDSEASLAQLEAKKEKPEVPKSDATAYGSGEGSQMNIKPLSDPLSATTFCSSSDSWSPLPTLTAGSKTTVNAKLMETIHEAETELELLRQMAGREHPTVADML